MELLDITDAYSRKEPIITYWSNGLAAKCLPIFGINETSVDEDDEEFVGHYYMWLKISEIIQYGDDDSVDMDNGIIEINLKNIPEKITLENGTVIWKNNY